MRIANYLRPDCVALRQRADSLQGAVQQLVALLDGAKVLTDTAVFAADVRARLELGGVCVGNGLAIPHAKSTAVEKLQLAALTLDPPLPCDTPDGQPLEMLFLIAAPAEANDLHVQVLVKYLVQYGEDPAEQLCTDDFAGHLAHNVNLAAKAIVGVACYARLTGDESCTAQAKTMAAHLLEKFGDKGNTPLTLDGQGWSMKYNLLWDKVLHLGLLPDSFYAAETASYLPRINTYGLPLDSRADYTKSDWICWTARMADDPAVRAALIAPVAKELHETTSRVPFSDWYDTKTNRLVAFIGRSVQGGLFALML